jgi:SAM-dependent methyltransferase
MKRLHLGCGRSPLAGWINLDMLPGTGVDVVADLDRCSEVPLPFEDNSVTEILGSHVLEHIHQPLPLMQELHRVAVPDARAEFRLPYGSSDDAYEDPTHVRQYFLHSFGYFSQPFYWRADYGYRGDWQPETVTLMVNRQRYQNRPSHEAMDDVMRLRNVVVQMTAVLRAVKPIRLPRRELQVPPRIELALVDG